MAMKKKGRKARRAYADEAVTAAAHPTRQTILKSLEGSNLTTVELEKRTGENRYNLYHHLDTLKEAGLVDFRMRDGRLKEFFLTEESDSANTFLQINVEELGGHEAFVQLLNALERLTGKEISNPDQIDSLQVMISFSEED
jgi:DNA-binding transcriptional ArsR family regulator